MSLARISDAKERWIKNACVRVEVRSAALLLAYRGIYIATPDQSCIAACHGFSAESNLPGTWPGLLRLKPEGQSEGEDTVMLEVTIMPAHSCGVQCKFEHWCDGPCQRCGKGYGSHGDHLCNPRYGGKHDGRGRWLCQPILQSGAVAREHP